MTSWFLVQCLDPPQCVAGKQSTTGKNGGGNKACRSCSPGKYSPTAVVFIFMYTRLISPVSTASVLAVLVVGLVHMYVYVGINLSIYLYACILVRWCLLLQLCVGGFGHCLGTYVCIYLFMYMCIYVSISMYTRLIWPSFHISMTDYPIFVFVALMLG